MKISEAQTFGCFSSPVTCKLPCLDGKILLSNTFRATFKGPLFTLQNAMVINCPYFVFFLVVALIVCISFIDLSLQPFYKLSWIVTIFCRCHQRICFRIKLVALKKKHGLTPSTQTRAGKICWIYRLTDRKCDFFSYKISSNIGPHQYKIYRSPNHIVLHHSVLQYQLTLVYGKRLDSNIRPPKDLLRNMKAGNSTHYVIKQVS